jgi:hypothetical protein
MPGSVSASEKIVETQNLPVRDKKMQKLSSRTLWHFAEQRPRRKMMCQKQIYVDVLMQLLDVYQNYDDLLEPGDAHFLMTHTTKMPRCHHVGEISGSYGGKYEDDFVLECCAV